MDEGKRDKVISLFREMTESSETKPKAVRKVRSPSRKTTTTTTIGDTMILVCGVQGFEQALQCVLERVLTKNGRSSQG